MSRTSLRKLCEKDAAALLAKMGEGWRIGWQGSSDFYIRKGECGIDDAAFGERYRCWFWWDNSMVWRGRTPQAAYKKALAYLRKQAAVINREVALHE